MADLDPKAQIAEDALKWYGPATAVAATISAAFWKLWLWVTGVNTQLAEVKRELGVIHPELKELKHSHHEVKISAARIEERLDSLHDGQEKIMNVLLKQ